MRYRKGRTKAHRGIETVADSPLDDTLEAFLSRQRSRVQSEAWRVMQRYRRRMLELHSAQDQYGLESKGLPQPWNHASKDNQL